MMLPVMSGKFALSDMTWTARYHGTVVLVLWVDSAEIASLAREISI